MLGVEPTPQRTRNEPRTKATMCPSQGLSVMSTPHTMDVMQNYGGASQHHNNDAVKSRFDYWDKGNLGLREMDAAEVAIGNGVVPDSECILIPITRTIIVRRRMVVF